MVRTRHEGLGQGVGQGPDRWAALRPGEGPCKTRPKQAGPWQRRGGSGRRGEFQQKPKPTSPPALQGGAWGAALDIRVEAGLFPGLH